MQRYKIILNYRQLLAIIRLSRADFLQNCADLLEKHGKITFVMF